MRIWRIVRERHLQDPWRPPEMSHRWNTTRHRVTYAALEPGTAVAEHLVYVKDVGQFGDRYLVEGEFDGTFEEARGLPTEWNAWPHTRAVQDYGDAWLEKQTACALVLPSALLPAKILMLNQNHPDFGVDTVDVHALAGLTRA